MAKYSTLGFVILATAAITWRATAAEPGGGEAKSQNRGARSSGGDDIQSIARDYRKLRLITKEPVNVDLQFSFACRSASVGPPSPGEIEYLKTRFGPHAHTSIRVFMNDAAAGAFRKEKTYPVGSVIVKEKTGVAYDVRNKKADADAKGRDGVGGMIKRPSGYDPAHGDWEYFYFDDPAKIERGKIKTCVACHKQASESDYVFGSWAPRPSARNAEQ